jgi:hypothetical protein
MRKYSTLAGGLDFGEEGKKRINTEVTEGPQRERRVGRGG